MATGHDNLLLGHPHFHVPALDGIGDGRIELVNRNRLRRQQIVSDRAHASLAELLHVLNLHRLAAGQPQRHLLIVHGDQGDLGIDRHQCPAPVVGGLRDPFFVHEAMPGVVLLAHNGERI